MRSDRSKSKKNIHYYREIFSKTGPSGLTEEALDQDWENEELDGERVDARLAGWWASDRAMHEAIKKIRKEISGEVGEAHPKRNRKRKVSFTSSLSVEEVGILESVLERQFDQLVEPVAPPVQLVEAITGVNALLFDHLKKNPLDLHRVHPRQFEELIAEVLASYGWRVQLTPTTRDGGYDIFAINRDISGLESAWLIECKKYRPDRPVGVEIVRSFWAVKENLHVPNGLIATTSYFTRGAEQFKASRYDLAFRDFEAIVEWINVYRPHPKGRLHIKEYTSLIGVPGRGK